MKARNQYFTKSVLHVTIALLTLMLTLPSCLKEVVEEPEVVICPPGYSFVEAWQEVGKRIGTAEWAEIEDGSRLIFWWNENASKERNGGYEYKGSLLPAEAGGYFYMDKDSISFLELKAEKLDTLGRASYSLDTALQVMTIRDTEADPVVEVRFKKIH